MTRKESECAKSKPHIAIVGGGIGGLFAANALIAHGLKVSVYEQAPALGEIGAGVYLTPNACAICSASASAPPRRNGARWSARSRITSATTARRSRRCRSPTPRAGTPPTACTAPTSSISSPPPCPPASSTAATAPPASRSSGDTARVTFANGATIEADVVVAADGIHSELRPYVFPPSKPVFHGTISYRGLVPRERLPDWPMDRWLMWAGPSKHFLVFPVRHGEMVNYVGFVPADAEMKESWSAPGNPDVLRAEFEGWDPRVGSVLAAGRHTASAGRCTTASRCRPGPRDG